MDKEPESQIHRESGEGSGIGEDTSQGGSKGGIGDEGPGPAAGTAPIAEQDNPDQTAHDAPGDDVGTPEEEPERTE